MHPLWGMHHMDIHSIRKMELVGKLKYTYIDLTHGPRSYLHVFDGERSYVTAACREPCERPVSDPCNQLPGAIGWFGIRLLVLWNPVGLTDPTGARLRHFEHS